MILKRGFLNWRYLKRRLQKSLVTRIASIAIISLGFLYFFTANQFTSTWIRDQFFDKSIFILSWVEQPFQGLDRVKERVAEHLYIYKNFDQVKDTLERISLLKNRNAMLEYENKKLNTLLNIPEIPEDGMLTVPCIGSKIISYRQVLFIRAGSAEGIKRKQPVYHNNQIIGQIDRVTPHASRVLLISDEKSRIPVCFSGSDSEGILTGDGNGNLIVAYRNSVGSLSEGEKVFTTGFDGVFPANKYVGHISRIKNGMIYVMPSANFHKLLYVQIQLNHQWEDVAGLLEEE
jgi:rod shape-determining protein MreC